MQTCNKCGLEPQKIGTYLLEIFVLGMCRNCFLENTKGMPYELLEALSKVGA